MFEEIGEYFLKLVPKIPGGIIVFFPSFSIMDKMSEVWLNQSNYGEMIENQGKTKIFVQPYRERYFGECIQKYKDCVDEKGKAILFVRFDSSFVDMLDCRDRYCRSVFLIGKPGLCQASEYVQLRMGYYEKLN